jgi:hypothetical protein
MSFSTESARGVQHVNLGTIIGNWFMLMNQTHFISKIKLLAGDRQCFRIYNKSSALDIFVPRPHKWQRHMHCTCTGILKIPSSPFEQGHAIAEKGVNQGGPSGLHMADIVPVSRTMTRTLPADNGNGSGDVRGALAGDTRSNSTQFPRNVRTFRSELL